MSGGLIARQLLLLAVTAATTAPMVANVMDSSSEHLRRRLLLAPPADAQAYEPCVDKPTPEGFTCDQQKGWGKCEEIWMLEGNFCRRTCNHCNLTSPPSTAAAEAGAPAPAALMQPTDGAPAPAMSPPPAFCSQPPVTGPCRGAMPSWYFDGGAATCRLFLYGGCQGNANRFYSFDECQAAAAQCMPSS